MIYYKIFSRLITFTQILGFCYHLYFLEFQFSILVFSLIKILHKFTNYTIHVTPCTHYIHNKIIHRMQYPISVIIWQHLLHKQCFCHNQKAPFSYHRLSYDDAEFIPSFETPCILLAYNYSTRQWRSHCKLGNSTEAQ